MDKNYNTIILGAGISGLAVAHHLQKYVNDFCVLEKASVAGGCVRTRSEDAYLVDIGPNSFQSSAFPVVELARELQLENEIIVNPPSSKARYIFLDGKLQAVPSGPGGLLNTKILSFKTKCRLLLEPFSSSKTPVDDESLGDFVRRKFGQDLLENLAGPFVSGVYAGDPELLSVAAAFPKIARLDRDYGSLVRGLIKDRKVNPRPSTGLPRGGVCSFKDGMVQLSSTLAENCQDRLHLDTEILRIEKTADGFLIYVRNSNGEQEYKCKRLISALSGAAAIKVFQSFDEDLSNAIDKIPTTSVAMVFTAFKRSDVAKLLDGFGFLIPRKEKVQLLGCIWSSSLFPNRVPQNHVGLTNFIGGVFNPDIVEQSAANIAHQVCTDLKTTMGIEARPSYLTVEQYKDIFPQYTIGHLDRVKRIDNLVAQHKDLHMLGNFMRGISVPDCIKQAKILIQGLFK